MTRSTWWTSILGLAVAGCASTTPGARPHEMSEAAHEREGHAHEADAERHAAQYDPGATTTRERCRNRGGRAARAGTDTDVSDVCWTSVTNPTDSHLREAELHRRHAADHRAGSAALRDAEARSCVGINPDERDASPFAQVDDIASVEPLSEQTGTSKSPGQRTSGAVVTFRAVPGMTVEWLQRAVDCHLARNAALGHMVPDMANCPLVPKGVQARVSSTGTGFAVAIRSDDASTAGEILARAQRLRSASGGPAPTP